MSDSSSISDPLSDNNFDIRIRTRNSDGTLTERWVPFRWVMDLITNSIDTDLADVLNNLVDPENLDEPGEPPKPN